MAVARLKQWHQLLRAKFEETAEINWKWLVPKILDDSFVIARRYDISSDSRALSFTFILSLVPLLAIAFTFFKLFGGLNHFLETTLKPLLAKNFPATVSAQINTFIDEFVSKMQTGTLGVVSFVTLLATVIALMSNIEGSFNRIFAARQSRPLLKKIGSYWIMLSVTPLVIVLSSAKSSELMNTVKAGLGVLSQFGVVDVLRYVVGHVVQVIGFASLFLILPERKPRIQAIFWGAVVTHLIFQALATINVQYASYVFSNSTNKQLYGSLPLMVLVFLIWVRLVWLGILFGACVCAAIDKHLSLRRRSSIQQPWSFPAETMLNCVRLLSFHIDTFNRQAKPPSAEAIALSLNIQETEVIQHHDRLVRKGLLIPVKFEDKDTYSPTASALSCHQNPEKLLSDLMDIPYGRFSSLGSEPQNKGLITDIERILLRIRES